MEIANFIQEKKKNKEKQPGLPFEYDHLYLLVLERNAEHHKNFTCFLCVCACGIFFLSELM